MEENNNNNSNSGVNYLFLIWLVLFVAKISGHIDWAWWIVFLPLTPFILVIGAFCASICFLVLVGSVIGMCMILYWIYERIEDFFNYG